MIPQYQLRTTALREWLEIEDIRFYYPGLDPWKCSYLKCVRLINHAKRRGKPDTNADMDESLQALEDRLMAGGA